MIELGDRLKQSWLQFCILDAIAASVCLSAWENGEIPELSKWVQCQVIFGNFSKEERGGKMAIHRLTMAIMCFAHGELLMKKDL